jgi:hypothetical protein
MKQLKDLTAQPEEFRAAAIPRATKIHRDSLINPTWTRRHDEDAIVL